MQINLPKYPTLKPSLHTELRNRIQEYFDSKKIKSTGNYKLYIKTIVLFTVFAGLYIHLVFFTPTAWLAIAECVLFGLTIAGIGFNVMHDGGHGSFSRRKVVNQLAAWSSNILGANSFMWNMKHNIIHHTYTNVEGLDDDIEAAGVLRFGPSQQRRNLHKYQHYYFWFFYSILYLWWVFVTDYKKYFTQKVGDIPLKKMEPHHHISFWGGKLLHAVLFVVLPIYLLGVGAWAIGFFTMAMVAGFSLSIVFQLAHTVLETSFPEAIQPENKMEDEFAVHQLKTTANFAMNSKIVSWFTGGLNYQIEHHLFPKISHIHYPAISKIVRQVCQEYDLPYISSTTFLKAVVQHIRFLKQMGRAPQMA